MRRLLRNVRLNDSFGEKMHLKLMRNTRNGRMIFEGLAKGDEKLEQVLHDWVLEVAYGLVSLTHIFNPPAIIIGGGVMEQESLVELVRTKVHELIINSFSDVEILKAELGNKAGLLGAASLHFSKVE